MPIDSTHWQPLIVYAVAAALLLMILQRLPVVGRFVRLAFSAALLAFMIFLVLQMAPYQPELSRLTGKLGLDDQQVSGKELRVAMSADGHFWVRASINGIDRRMLIDSGATITALSATARATRRSTSLRVSRPSFSRPPTARLQRGPGGSMSSGSAISSRATCGSSPLRASARWTCLE